MMERAKRKFQFNSTSFNISQMIMMLILTRDNKYMLFNFNNCTVINMLFFFLFRGDNNNDIINHLTWLLECFADV